MSWGRGWHGLAEAVPGRGPERGSPTTGVTGAEAAARVPTGTSLPLACCPRGPAGGAQPQVAEGGGHLPGREPGVPCPGTVRWVDREGRGSVAHARGSGARVWRPTGSSEGTH